MKVKTNFLIDIGIFIAMLLALIPALTGIPIHEWLSVALAAAIVIHLLLHWDWIVNVLFKFFKRIFQTSRLQFVVDFLLFAAFNAVMLSGFLISQDVLPFIGIRPLESPVMRTLHSLSADATLILTGVHFALSWNWIVSAVRRCVISPIASVFSRKPLPAPVAVEISQE